MFGRSFDKNEYNLRSGCSIVIDIYSGRKNVHTLVLNYYRYLTQMTDTSFRYNVL